MILSDVDGFYTKDPRQNPKAELISEIEEMIDTEVAGETNTDYLEHLKEEK